jgi:hypothetical protein
MKLLLDDSGNAVLQDGMPVYQHEDGTKAPLDAPALVKKVGNFEEERNRYHGKISTLEGQVKLFTGEDGKVFDHEAVKKAMKTVANLNEEQLYTADRVDVMKKQLGEQFEQDKSKLIDQHSKALQEKDATLEKLNQDIRGLLVKTAFSQSEYFSGGDKSLTTLPPDIAANTFGKFFEVVGEGENAKLVGKINGEPIQSKKRYGELATFDEAIAVIIENYPAKNSILRASGSGPGAHGNMDQGGTRQVTISRTDAMDPQKYRDARKLAAERRVELVVKD